MRYILFRIGQINVYSYGLMIAIGILAAFSMTEYRATKKGLEKERIFNLGIWCVIGGLLGAKLLYYITELPAIIKNPVLLKNISEGFVVYGGIIGGIFAGFLYCKKNKLDFLSYFDLVMPSISLAQGFGRIGCFLAGCCYGRETNSWFGVVFHDSPYAPSGVALIPTQLISAVADFLLFFILVYLSNRIKAEGTIAGCYLIFYSIGRFLIEFLRNDERGTVGALSTSQFISCFLLIIGICICMITQKRSKRNAQRLTN